MFLESNILIVTIKTLHFQKGSEWESDRLLSLFMQYLRFIFHSWNYPPSTLSPAFWRHSFVLCENMHLRKGICLSKNKTKHQNLSKYFAKLHSRAVTLKASTGIRIVWETYLKCTFPFPSPYHWPESQEWGGDVRPHFLNSLYDALIS